MTPATPTPPKDLLTLVISNGGIGALAVLIAAVLSAFALWQFNSHIAQKARRADYIREQIGNLYGPVTFLLEKGDRAFAMHNKIMAGYDEYFATRHGEQFSDQITLVIKIQNEFGQLARDGRKEAADVVRHNRAWLDADDGGEVGDFLTSVDRLAIEFDAESKIRLPHMFYRGLKNSLTAPVIHDSKLVTRFREKLHQKQAELSGLPRPIPEAERYGKLFAILQFFNRIKP